MPPSPHSHVTGDYFSLTYAPPSGADFDDHGHQPSQSNLMSNSNDRLHAHEDEYHDPRGVGLEDVDAHEVHRSPEHSPPRYPPSTHTAPEPNDATTPKGVLMPSGSANASRQGSADAYAKAPRVALTDPMADMRQRNIDPITGRLHPATRSTTPTASASQAQGGYFATTPSQVGALGTNTPVSDTESVVSEDFHDDDFHWSDDEAVEEAAKFEEQLADKRRMRIGRFSLVTIFHFLCLTFLGNLVISIVLIGPVLGMHFGYRPNGRDQSPSAEHKRYVSDNVEAWFIWASFNLHISWWLHAFVNLVPRMFIEGIRFIWGSVNQRIKTIGEAYNTLKPALTPITYAAAAWASWEVLFDPCYNLYNHGDPEHSRASYTYRLYQVLELYFFVTLTWGIEQMLVKLIAIRFHKVSYAERVAAVTHALTVFDTLKDRRPKHNKKASKGTPGPGGNVYPDGQAKRSSGLFTFNRQSKQPGSVSIDMSGGTSLPGAEPSNSLNARPTTPAPAALDTAGSHAQQHPPTTYGHRLRVLRGQAGKVGSRATAMGKQGVKVGRTKAIEMAKVAVQNPFDLLSSKAVGVSVDINSPDAAKRLAKALFNAYRGHHKRPYLIPSDFEPAFSTPAEATDAFSVFDRDGNGDVSQAEVKNTVLATYKERRMLAKAMQDVNQAVHQLDMVFLCVVAIIVLFEALAIFRVDISKTLSSFYSLIIAFAFIFKESAANLFDSIIFLFVTHPFDTGDRISFVGADGTPAVMIVKQMSLLSSVFLQWDQTEVYIANSLLSGLVITNYRRSGYQAETATLQFAFDTPQEKLDAVEEDMQHWLATEPARLFEPSTSIVPIQYDYMRSIEVSLTMTHRRNFQDWGGRWGARNAFVAALLFYCKKHGIRYAEAPMPIVYAHEELAGQWAPPAYHDGFPRVTASYSSSASTESDTESDSETPQRVPHQAKLKRRKTNVRGQAVSSLYDDSFDKAFSEAPILGGTAVAGDPLLRPTGAQTPTGVSSTLSPQAALMGFLPPADEFGGRSVMRRRTATKAARKLAASGGGG